MAVLNFLADSFPEARLGGDGTPRGRADVNRCLAFVHPDLHPASKPLVGPTAVLQDESLLRLTNDPARSPPDGLVERADTPHAAHPLQPGRPLYPRPSLPLVP